MNRTSRSLCILLCYTGISFAQKYTPAIEDNSFFIEEAFNQEKGVVQHAFTGYFSNSTSKYFAFSQEWPLGSQTHQFSYTIPYSSPTSNINGIGDISLTYRYQMWDGDNWAWCSPRISIIFPTGNSDKGLGAGSMGIQGNIPISKRISNLIILHGNGGLTYYPQTKKKLSNGDEIKKDLTSFFLGGSGIALLSQNFNILCEVLYNSSANISYNGTVEHFDETILSPGVRYAFTFHGLQIVPGIAVPISFTESETEVGFFLFLSLEHFF
jgi:hypothetical protein